VWRGGQKERGNEDVCGGYGYLVSIFENRRMKPVEIVLRGEKGEQWRR
jgi:hypothetical protein